MTRFNTIQYRQFIYRPESGDLVSGNEAPDLMAYSTMREPTDVNDISMIHMIKQGALIPPEVTRNRIWIHDILDDYNIPYLVEMASVWLGRRKHGEVQFIYVLKADRKRAIDLKRKFENATEIVSALRDDMYLADGTIESLPQVTCKHCGKEFDFDYYKCPHCKQKR